MDRVKVLSVMTILVTTSSAIMAEPPSSYGAPSSSSSFGSFSSSFRNSFLNRNQDNTGFPSFRNGVTPSTLSSLFDGSMRGTDPALLAASIPGPKVFRHISLFIAPQETEQQSQVRTIRPQQAPDKHVQIIFVKPPSTSKAQQTEVILPEQPEQKTLVYVLLKKPEANENNVKIRGPAPTNKPPAPEVYFIKYKDDAGASASSSVGGISSSFGNGGNDNGFAPIRSSGTYSTSYGAPQ